jgi:glycosyltransferase involved in cell wall biosynthesis
MNALFERTVSSYIAVSHAVAERSGLAKAALPHRVIPNFLPDNYFSPAHKRTTSGLPDRAFIMFAGALRRIKGIDELMVAYGLLPEQRRPPLVVMGYTGSEGLAGLENLPQGATVIVNRPRSAVQDAMWQSLFVVVPSISEEAFGLVALEAMAAGRAVIASRIGGLKEVVSNGETGLLVEPGDIAALTAAMTTLIEDAELRDRLGQNGRIAAAQFGEAQVVPQIESVYSSLLTPSVTRVSA